VVVQCRTAAFWRELVAESKGEHKIEGSDEHAHCGQLSIPDHGIRDLRQARGRALREEAERLGAKRVYLIVSRTLNTTTDEIEKIRKALGDRHAETFDGIPQHTTRELVVLVVN
jgi:hypothetical protein